MFVLRSFSYRVRWIPICEHSKVLQFTSQVSASVWMPFLCLMREKDHTDFSLSLPLFAGELWLSAVPLHQWKRWSLSAASTKVTSPVLFPVSFHFSCSLNEFCHAVLYKNPCCHYTEYNPYLIVTIWCHFFKGAISHPFLGLHPRPQRSRHAW